MRSSKRSCSACPRAARVVARTDLSEAIDSITVERTKTVSTDFVLSSVNLLPKLDILMSTLFASSELSSTRWPSRSRTDSTPASQTCHTSWRSYRQSSASHTSFTLTATFYTSGPSYLSRLRTPSHPLAQATARIPRTCTAYNHAASRSPEARYRPQPQDHRSR